MKSSSTIQKCPADEEIEIPRYIGHRRSFWWVYVPCGLAALGAQLAFGAGVAELLNAGFWFALLAVVTWHHDRTVNKQERWAYRAGYQRGWLDELKAQVLNDSYTRCSED